MALDCAGHSILGAGSSSGVLINSSSNVVVKNCHITNCDSGIKLHGLVANSLILDNTLLNNAHYGIIFSTSTGSTHNNITNNIIGNDPSINNVIIKNCAISGFDTGIYVQDGNTITLKNNTMFGNSVSGIDFSTYFMATPTNQTNNVITANTIQGSQLGIYMNQSAYGNITSNNLNGNGEGAYIETSNHITIYNNNVSNSASNGLELPYMSNYNVSNNQITKSTGYGIYFYLGLNPNTKGSNVTSNTIRNNNQGGIKCFSLPLAKYDPGTFLNNIINSNFDNTPASNCDDCLNAGEPC